MKKIEIILPAILGCLTATSVNAQRDFSTVVIETVKVTDTVYMLKGAGGNIGLSVGKDGVIVIDDQFAPLTDQILAAISDITDQPVRFIINTHFHQDHIDGNEGMSARTGGIIVAHENVRKRLSTPQFVEFFNNRMPAYPPGALPIVTFDTNIRFYMNGDEIEVFHPVDNAHTDSDSVIFFHNSNVLHGGDLVFFGTYPFIDLGSGGSVRGFTEATEAIIAQLNDDTQIIPGHGSVGDLAQLRAVRDMLVTLIDRVRRLVDQGKTREEVIAARPSAEFDEKYVGRSIKADDIVGFVYDDLTGK